MNNRRFLHLPLPSAIALVLASTAVPAFAGNTVTGFDAVVAGGDSNTASGTYSAVGGGDWNTVSGTASAVGGGEFNTASGSGDSVVGGGNSNTASGDQSTISGGQGNLATSEGAVVAGGYKNTASGGISTVGGGWLNNALGWYTTVPGGLQNTAGGDYSFAAGVNAHIRSAAESGNPSGDTGTFMWGDSSCTGTCVRPYTSTGINQFLIRANGGFALNTTPVNPYTAMTISSPLSNPGYASVFMHQSNSDNGILVSSGDASTGLTNSANNAQFYVDQFNGSSQKRLMSLNVFGLTLGTGEQAYKPGGGAWAASSDARLKTNVQPLDHALDRLLSLRGVTFEYANPDSGMHPAGTFTGFIAQEVEPNFPNWIGHDEKGYMTVGPQGFEALTVEALRTLKSEDDARMTSLEAEDAALRAQLATSVAELRQQVAALSASSNVRKGIASACSGE